jgi:hypothetical protein
LDDDSLYWVEEKEPQMRSPHDQLSDRLLEKLFEDLPSDSQMDKAVRLGLRQDFTIENILPEGVFQVGDLGGTEKAFDLHGDLPALLVRGNKLLRTFWEAIEPDDRNGLLMRPRQPAWAALGYPPCSRFET